MDWRCAAGKLKEMSCRKALLKLHRKGHIELPAPRRQIEFRAKSCEQVKLDVEPGAITQIKQFEVVLVEGKRLSGQWNTLVREHHDLGYRPLAGAQLRYLIRSEQGFVAALGFRSAALRSKARDRWIGWSDQARQAYIDRVVCNARFAIVGGVKVKNFASQVLSHVLKRLPDDWHNRYARRPLLVETYVDTQHHRGTCYRAAGWEQVGYTRGASCADRRAGRQKSRKAIWAYGLQREFRAKLCEVPGPARLGPAGRLRHEMEIAKAHNTQDWTQAEFHAGNLGDHRLQRRLCKLARAFDLQPNASIPQACGSAAASRAAYRFFDRVKMQSILEPHYGATMERAAKEAGYVLAVNDTTTLNFAAHPATEGLGLLQSEHSKARGLWMHSTLVMTTQGTALGLIDVQVWARTSVGQGAKRHRLPIEQKESNKWFKSYAAASRLQRQVGSELGVVHVGDRESDIYEYFAHVVREPGGAQALVRADSNERKLADNNQSKVRDYLLGLDVQEQRLVELPRRHNRAPRQAQLQIRFATVRLQSPYHHRKVGNIELSVVYVNEIHAPAGVEPIEWMLWTTLGVESVEQAWEKVDWYKRRWAIEDFHRTLKSGCRIEDRQLTTADRLMSCLAIDVVVAARIEQMKKLAREQPDLGCIPVFDQSEMEVLQAHFDPQALSTGRVLTMREAVRYTARLGGFLARKSDGQPGSTTLWRGLDRLTGMALGWKLARMRSPPAD